MYNYRKQGSLGGVKVKYCTNCGKEIDDDAVMCLNCCYVVPSSNTPVQEAIQEPVFEEVKASTGLVVLSILFPIVGLILSIIKWKETPKAAKTYLTAALIAWGVSLLIFCNTVMRR